MVAVTGTSMASDGWDILDLVEESVFVRDLEGRVLTWNKASETLYGWSREQVAGRVAQDLLKTEYSSPAADVEAGVLATGHWEGEVKRVSALGAAMTILVRWRTRTDAAGRPLAIVETGRDITTRKHTEDALRYSEHRYHNLFRAMAASFWELDFSGVDKMLRALRKSGVEDFRKYLTDNPAYVREMMRATRVIDVNDETVALFGRGRKEDLLGNVEPFWPEESTQAYAEGILSGVAGKPHYSIECKLRRIDGSAFDALFTAAYPPESMGKGTLVIGVIDITERKQAFAKLEASERRYRDLFHYMPIGLTQVDASKLIPMFKELRAVGVIDLKTYIDEHPEFLTRAVDALVVEEVNQHNVDMFGASSAAEMKGPITRYWQPGLDTIRRSIEARYSGQEFFQEETKVARLDGQVIDVLFSTARPGDIADKSLVGFIDITGRRKTDEALRTSEYRYRNMFQAMAASFWELDFSGANEMVRGLLKTGVTDLRKYFAANPEFVRDMMRVTHIVDVNDQTVALFGGGDRGTLRGHVERFWPEESTHVFAESYVQATERKPNFSTECKLRRFDGSLFDGLFTVAYPPREMGRGNTMVGVIDITARKQSERALRASEQRYQNLFQAMAVSFWEMDFSRVGGMLRELRAAGVTDLRRYFKENPSYVREIMRATRVVDVNDQTVALFGRGSKHELLGTTEAMWPEESWPAYAEAILSSLDHKPSFSVETRLRRLDGTIFDAAFTVWYSAEDRTTGLAGVLDISERVRAQSMLSQVQADFAHAARVSMLGELTASIAHEVNQPLAAIATNGEAGLRWLARPVPDVAEVRELTKRIVADARRAADVISRIRAMAARRVPEQTPLPLDEVIREALLFLRHEVQSRGVTVTHHPAATAAYVRADRTQLQQVVVNLAVNAMQAMAQAESRERRITIRTSVSDAGAVTCEIEDTGPGVAAQHATRLFESFFTTKDGGMGMGLPICRSIIEAHGGSITADNNSAPGGARFSFTLPAATKAH
jgi:PAS domain S-box-containing protein